MIKTRIHQPQPGPSARAPQAKPKGSASFGLTPRLILPSIVFVALMMTGVRVNSVFDMLEKGDLFGASSQTASVPMASLSPENQAPSRPLANTAIAAEAIAKPAEAAAPSAKAHGGDEEDASPPTGAEADIINQLAKRRQEIDDRAKELDTREALIRVAEQRVDQKVKEMESLRNQVQVLLNQAGAAQQAQIENLVKIYETMKPKEAAKIFEALDMPILMGVVQKMKPQRVSAIMAEMAPEKAKEITVALTKQDQLPQLK